MFLADTSLWGKSQPKHNSVRVNHGSKEILLHWLIGSCRQLAPAAPHVRAWQALTFSRREVSRRRRASDGYYLPLNSVMRTAHREAVTDTQPRWRLTLDANLLNPLCAVMTRHICLSGLYLTVWLTDWQGIIRQSSQTNSQNNKNIMLLYFMIYIDRQGLLCSWKTWPQIKNTKVWERECVTLNM